MRRISSLFIIFALLESCAIRSGMYAADFPVDTYWANETQPSRPYKTIGPVSLSEKRYYGPDVSIKKDLLTHYGTLPKGNSYDEKEILIYQLSLKAKKMGADAVLGIQYQLVVSQKTYEYHLSGLAIQYTDEPVSKKRRR